MRNSLLVILIVLISCNRYSAPSENIDVSTEVEKISRSVLTNKVSRDYAEGQLLNLLHSNSSSESRGIVYTAIAKIYRRDIGPYAEKVAHYAQEALKNQISVDDACDMYTYLVDAADVRAWRNGTTTSTAELENLAKIYIQGLAFVLDHLRINKSLPLPGVGKYDVEPQNPQYEEIVRKHDMEMAARNDAEQQNKLLTLRDNFTRRLLVIYPQSKVNSPDFDGVVRDAVGSTGNVEKVLQYLRSVANKQESSQ